MYDNPPYPRFDPLALAAFGLVIYLGIRLLLELFGGITFPTQDASLASASSYKTVDLASGFSLPFSLEDMADVAAPYSKYTLTQGPHGASYGHLAVDLAAGRGKPLLSPINGVVTEITVDEYGNPTLVIENSLYRVSLLHAKYDVEIGQVLRIGDRIGVESNRGYTTDFNGVPCKGRKTCGNHTHLNIFDKNLGKNVNPLDLLPSTP